LKTKGNEDMMINFQALRYFEMVARHEHFTKAANELFISQSTLSKAIDNLERDIGVKLFEKNGRNIQLTS
jgi:DNA-binding transcriptional LysR family regulator